MQALSSYFDAHSPLADAFAPWVFRPGQLTLAQAIDEALKTNRPLLAQAGTGTGKTLAYLLPALLSGKKILVSTHSKHLQDQLADRDVPALLQALQTTAQVAKLKGRQNYVCVHRLNDSLKQGTFFQREDIQILKDIQIAVQQGLVNERGDMPGLAEDHPVWQNATARPDQCLGQNCPEIKNCHTARAKRAAMMADIVVVNHHLLCADIAMRAGGVAEVLPECDVVVVDEAHQMAASALGFFGSTWSSGTVLDWARSAPVIATTHSASGSAARTLGQNLQASVRKLTQYAQFGRQSLAQAVGEMPDLPTYLSEVATAQTALTELLEGLKDLSPDLMSLYQRGVALGADLAAQLKQAGTAPSDSANVVYWYERSESSLRLHATPLDAGHAVGHLAHASGKPWLFVSATLAHHGRFDLALGQLGLQPEQTDTLIVASPFDYPRQGRLFIPRQFAPANSFDHAAAVAAHAAELAGVLGGRTVVLCTSRRAVARISEALQLKLDNWCTAMREPPIAVLSQLEHGRTTMLAHFRANPRAVLVGAAALWEGLDLPGNLLNAVVIDKIPFGQPDDPVFAARLKQVTAEGGSSFDAVQLPEAALSLQQGTGRLIRTEADWGVISVLDTRLKTAGYGRRLVSAMPAFTQVDSVDELLGFCEGKLAAGA